MMIQASVLYNTNSDYFNLLKLKLKKHANYNTQILRLQFIPNGPDFPGMHMVQSALIGKPWAVAPPPPLRLAGTTQCRGGDPILSIQH